MHRRAGTRGSTGADRSRRAAAAPRRGTAPTRSRLQSALFDLEPEVLDHAVVRLRRLARRREIVADEDRVRRKERQRLQRTEVQLPPTCDADLLRRTDKAKQSEDFEAAAGVEI